MPIIEAMWAWVATEAEGEEGVLAHELTIQGRRMIAPLVGADEARIRSLEPYARAITKASGKPARLVRFDRRTDLESILP